MAMRLIVEVIDLPLQAAGEDEDFILHQVFFTDDAAPPRQPDLPRKLKYRKFLRLRLAFLHTYTVNR